jgi:hypothetical protein
VGVVLGALALLAAVAGLPTSVPAAHAAGPCTANWREVGATTFQHPISLTRSQGLTTDGTRWWFSWQYGLSRAAAGYLPTAVNPMAIPPKLALAGSNHIGDIDLVTDVHGTPRILAPIEDGNPPLGGPEYQHSWLVFYNANTLLPTGERYELPHALHLAGVPWVAVEHEARLAITAEWDNTSVINFFSIDQGMALHHQLPLSRTVGRIQGAKVWGDWLYASRDDAAKSVVRINLDSGLVEDLHQLGYAGEQEGIALRPTADGAFMHVLFIHGSTSDPAHLKVVLHHLAPPCGFVF